MVSCEFDEEPSIRNLLLDLEVVIERPVELVWRHWINLGSWVMSHEIESVYGDLGTVGSIMRVSNKRGAELGSKLADVPLPHYHYCKIIKLVPERHYVLKTYSENGGSYGIQMAGFDEARFTAAGEKTRVAYSYRGAYKSEQFIGGPFIKDHDDDDNHMLNNLTNLKRIAEGR